MRAGIVAWCVGLALLLSGCDSTDTRYFRYGIGTNLYSEDIVQTTQFQDLYLTELCRQALPVLSASQESQCINAVLRPSDWNLIVQAGLNDVDRRCDSYLAWLDDRRRTNNAILKQIGDTLVASQGIMRLTGVGADPITIAGLAFGFATNTFTNINSRLLLEVDKTTVQTVVFRRRNEFRLDLAEKNITNRPTADHALRLYLTICTPFTIETEINSTVTIFQTAGARALDAKDPLVSASSVGTRVIRDATMPLTVPPKPPRIVSPTRFNPFEEGLTKRQIEDFQKAVCVSPTTGDLGPAGSETRKAIQRTLNAPDELLTDRKGILLRRKLRDGPKCGPS